MRHHARKYGKSKYGVARYLRGFLDLLTVVMLTRFAYRPGTSSAVWARCFLMGGGAVLAYLAGLKLFTGASIGGRPLLLFGVLVVIVGMQLVLFGLLAELVISRTQRPVEARKLVCAAPGRPARMKRALSTLMAVALTAVCLWFLLTPDVLEVDQAPCGRRTAHPDLGRVAARCRDAMAARLALRGDGHGPAGLPDTAMVRISLQLSALNFILPFRLGELSFPMLMRRHYGYGFLHATGVLLLARLIDLATVGSILLAAAAWLHLPVGIPSALLALFALVLAATPFGMALAGQALRPWLTRLPSSAISRTG